MSSAPQSLNSVMQGILRQHRPAAMDVAAIFDPSELEKERQLRIRLLALGAAAIVAILVMALLS